MLRRVPRDRLPPGAERRLRARAAAPPRGPRRAPEVIALVHAAFAHRRKALAGSLALAPGAPDDIRDCRARRPRADRPSRRTPAPSGCPPRTGCAWPTPIGPSASRTCGRDDPRDRAAAMTRVTEHAFAKLNLVLHVGRRRRRRAAPALLALRLARPGRRAARGAERPSADRVECPGVAPEDNLAGAALAAFRERVADRCRRSRVQIDKRIPVAAGLGGGSADAAAALRAANRIAGKPLAAAALRELARRPGLGRPQPGRAAPRAGRGRGRDRRAGRAAAAGRRARASATRACRPAEVYAAARSHRAAGAIGSTRSRSARCSPAAARTPRWPPRSRTTSSRPPWPLRPELARRPRRPARRGRARRARERLGPHLLRAVRGPGRCGGRRAADRRSDRHRAAAD